MSDGSVEDHERWLVVDGRRWRRQDPALPADLAARLLSHLGRGRSGVRAATSRGEDPASSRRRVDLAKRGLGERGVPWWGQTAEERRLRWSASLEELDRLDDQGGGPTHPAVRSTGFVVAVRDKPTATLE